eukprot:TRINITY_DN9218_c0_g1_i1.p1 TRINITY_DN9218_c0_g1~~TRINITY_DN9218_c0_g1_i1.p1  ORF type:complete len:455 (+),score=173.39 TRINITY_DN9218_c0_g1_i1:52-1416(+)
MAANDAPTPPQPSKPEATEDSVLFEDVATAAYRVREGVIRSRLTKAREGTVDGWCNNLFIKHEHRQHTGSFKERGALNAMLLMTPEQRKRGVIAASAGNHALALAYHGRRLGIPVTVVMPLFAPLAKVNRCREFGATIHLHGANIQEAREEASEMMKETGQTYINGYDDPAIIAGTGTIGIEILEQLPDTEAVVVPIGGGGLIAGVALAIKKLRPDVQVIGVEPKNCDSYTQALAAGKPVRAATRVTLADGLNVPEVGGNAFAIARKYVDKTVVVDEKWIAVAILKLLEHERFVVEGGGATGIAGLLSGQLPELKNKKTVAILCGSNVDTTVLGRVIERGLFTEGRLVNIDCPISDRPGGLANFCSDVHKLGGNIIHIHHERAPIADINIVSVRCSVECMDEGHKRKILNGLRDQGYDAKELTGDGPRVKDPTRLHRDEPAMPKSVVARPAAKL